VEQVFGGTGCKAAGADHTPLHWRVCGECVVRTSAAHRDVDYVSAVPHHRIQELQALAGRGSELENKFKVHLQHVTVTTMPEDYEARLVEMFAGRFKNLRMFARSLRFGAL
jgi:hypothetical protein